MAAKKYLVIGDLRGGRNGSDPPLSLPDDQAVDLVNIDFWNATLGHKRPGSEPVAVAFDTASGGPFTGYLSSIWATYGGSDYLCAVDSAGVKGYRTAGGTGWKAFGVTATVDAISGNYQHVESATFNAKCFVAAQTAVDRLHVFANGAADNLRRVGLATPAVPTLALAGSGSVAALTHYYKVAWTVQSSGVTVRRSELSAVASKTHDGSSLSITVTQPTVAAEGETHWELYACGTSTGLFVLIATTAIATTTYSDTNADPSTYTGTLCPLIGANTSPGSWKHICTNGNRLLGGGSWTSGAKQSRVWYTPVLGVSDVGDDERVPTPNYVDLDEGDGDVLTGFVGDYQGNTLAFKRGQIWKLVPTGNGTTPYSKTCLTKAVGCIEAKTIVEAEDESGNPAIYFLSEKGPYRIGSEGLQYCGRDVEDIWGTVNRGAGTSGIVGHGVYHASKRQVWFYLTTGTDAYPSLKIVLDTRFCRPGVGGIRRGWAQHSGPSCTVRCSTMYSTVFVYADTNMIQSPYVGSAATANLLLQADTNVLGTHDNGTNYQAYVLTKPYCAAGLGFNFSMTSPFLNAAAANATVTLTIYRDYYLETRLSTVTLAATATEARVERKFEGLGISGAGAVQFKLGDGAAANQGWVLDALMVPYMPQAER